MTKQRTTKVSKFLSLVLRHEPQKVGLTLDDAGWVDVRDLLDALARHGFPVEEIELNEVVATSDKKRFSFSDDGLRIRANQGHSVGVELGYTPVAPPEVLYHGTPERFVESIRESGLIKRQRHHVHLSVDEATASKVGERRGRPVILKIDASRMHRDGIEFYVSANGVWLTDHVPAKYIALPTHDVDK
jgi:putative RNA 2'-phosphotransferase